MVKQTIQIFCRVKPTKHPIGVYEVNESETVKSQISFNVPHELAGGFINNKKENYEFSFDRIFDQNTKQEKVFSYVAEPVIENVLSGFNGTIFAYGQTGSGKTFTITGGAERFADRGIIPRSLSHVFQHITKNPGYIFTTHISYLEIYNESGFDLLDPKHEASKLEDLPKISLLEDNDGNIHLKNLSIHQAANEEEALNLLFLGDTNRMIAETPMNQASTRSHCIFTIHVSVTEPDSATIRRSKLHLVDLAGSERVSKTGVGGTLLKEAKYINLSLHFLEQVIIALSEKSRSHIPYRNSMMTSVLRDSLGGNCMTSMIATCSAEKKNIDESISTCRFAQRVALIRNDAVLNEELDPKLMIAKLKREIQQLKDELALCTGVQYDGDLTDEDRERLQALVQSYIEDQDIEARLSVGADMRKIHYCFQLLKKYCINNIQNLSRNKSQETEKMPDQLYSSSEDNSYLANTSENSYLANTSEVKKLKDLIFQRDNEINILVNMLKKEKQRADTYENKSSHPNTNSSISPATLLGNVQSEIGRKSSTNVIPDEEYAVHKMKRGRNALLQNLNQKNAVSLGRQEAFEIFKRDYIDNHLIEENRRGLKNRYLDAKHLGEQVNKSRELINSSKGNLEKLKMRRSLNAAASGNLLSGNEEDLDEKMIRRDLDEQKNKYKQAFNQLKLLKTEIEHMQHLMEKSKLKMQKDFEMWWAEQAANLQQQQQKYPPRDIRAAWKTPPLTPLDNSSTDKEHLVKTKQHSTPMSSRHEDHPTRDPSKDYSSTRKNTFSEYKTRPDWPRTGSRYAENDTRQTTDKINSSHNSMKSSRTSVSSSSSHSEITSSVESRSSSSSIRLTGDQKTDEDILAFMKAREELMRKVHR